MKVKLKRSRDVYGRRYSKGAVVDVPPLFARRLIYLNDAEKGDGKVSVSATRLPEGIPYRGKLIEHDFDTKEKVLSGDLTSIKGVGKATQEYIKDALR